MQENIDFIDMIVHSTYFKTSIGAVITALVGWIVIFLKNTNKKINNAATKDELDRAKNEAFKYTEHYMKIHEDKQILELCSMNKTIDKTHEMVEFLYQTEIQRKNK